MVKRHPCVLLCTYLIAGAAAFAQSSYVFQLPAQSGLRPQVVGLGDNDFHRSISASNTLLSGASKVLVTPSGTKFYILAPGGVLSANQNLTTISALSAVSGAATAAEMSPDGKFLFVIAGGHFYILNAPDHIFNASDNLATQADTGVPTGATPIGVAASHDGKIVWILSNTNGGSTVTALNLATFEAAASPLNLQSSALSMVLSSRGLLYVTTNTRLYEIDPASFTVTTFGTITLPGPTGPLQFTPDGNTAYFLNFTACDACSPIFKFSVASHTIASLAPPSDGGTPPAIDQVVLAGNDRVFGLSPAPTDECSFCRKLWDFTITPFGLKPSNLSLSPGFLPTNSVVAAAVSDERPSARFLYLFASDHNIYRVNLVTNGVDGVSSLDPANGFTLSFVPIPAQSGANTIFQINASQDVSSGSAAVLIAQVLDSIGRPVFGVPATFAGAGVTIPSPSVVTTAGGWAQTTVTAPTTPGTYPITLTVGSLQATFQLVVAGNGNPGGGSAQMSIYTGDGQLLRQNQSTINTKIRPAVKVVDANQSPLANVVVTFHVSEGPGQVSPVTSTTDANGLAQTDFFSGSINNSQEHFKLSKVTASTDLYGSVEFAEVTQDAAVNDLFPPNSRILTPPDRKLSIPQGATKSGALTVQTFSEKDGKGIPNVGLRLADPFDPTLVAFSPVVSCVGLSRSDNNGVSRCDVLAACQPGVALPRDFTAVVSVGEYQHIPVQVTVTPGVPSLLTRVFGDGQSGHPGDALTLIGRASDGCTLPAGGLSGMTWTVLQGTAIITPQTTTDGAGNVSAKITLGQTPGPVRIQLGGPGLQPIVFNLTNKVVVSSISLVSGGGQSAVIGQPFTSPVVFVVKDVGNSPAAGLTVNFSLSGIATFSPSSAVTNAQGQVQTNVTAGATPGTIVLTASVDAFSTTATLSSRLAGPVITTTSFTNSASGAPGLTPCGLVTVIGVGLAPTIQGVITGSPSGYSITANGSAAPIQAIANVNGVQQINFQAPCDLTAGTAAVVVTINGSSTTVPGVPVSDVQPGMFTFTIPGKTKTYGAVLRAVNGTYVTPDNPARLGEKLYLVVTGLGQTTPAAVTNVAGIGQPTVFPVIVGVADRGTQVNYSRYLTGGIGLYLIEFQIPLDAPTGADQALAVAVQKSSPLSFVFGNPVYIPAVAAP